VNSISADYTWKTEYRSQCPSLPYPITLFNADSASAECSATTIGSQPDESRFSFFGQCAGKIRHAIGDLVRQRLYAIACGYPDGNDAGRLGADPISKLLCGRDPVKGEDLASQPTLSRFENALDRADLYRMSVALADTVIERHRRRLKRKVKRITIDLDPMDDPTHGAQQLSFFNGHYDTWCFLPVAGFLTFNEEAEQYLFAYVLRPGNATASAGAIGILSRLLPRLRAAFPRATCANSRTFSSARSR
jgi:Transposase DDE domain group 1